MMDQPTTIRRLLTLVIACIENLIYGAVILGWPSLVFVFKQMGYFDSYCNGTSENATSALTLKPTASSAHAMLTGVHEFRFHGNATPSHFAAIIRVGGAEITTPCYTPGLSATNRCFHGNETTDGTIPLCWEQDSQLQMVFSVAVLFSALSMFPAGLFFDKYGMRHTRTAMTMFLFSGHLLCGLSATTGNAYLTLPGMVLLVLASTMLITSSMQIGNLFPTHRATAISCIQGSYGAAVLLFYAFKAGYEIGLPISISFFTVAGITVFLNINTFVFLPKDKIPWPQEQCDSKNYTIKKGERLTELNEETGINHGAIDLSDETLAEVTHFDSGKGTETHTHTPKKQRFDSLRDCLASLPFLLVLVWQVVLEIGLIFTIGTVNYFLTLKADGDEQIVSRYTDIMSITLASVFLVGPVGGLLIDRKKTWRALTCHKEPTDRLGPTLSDASLPVALTSLTSIACSFFLLFGDLRLQIITFVSLLFIESLLFGVGSAVVAMIFPTKHFASVYGALRTISGLATFLQYPIFFLIRQVLANDPFHVVMALIIADIVTLLFPAYLFFSSKSVPCHQNALHMKNRQTTEKLGV